MLRPLSVIMLAFRGLGAYLGHYLVTVCGADNYYYIGHKFHKT